MKDFAKKLMEDHHTIDEAIDSISGILDGEVNTEARSLIQEKMTVLKDCLKKHFQLEEASGILHDLLEDDPALESKVSRLFSEHQDLCEAIDHCSCQDDDVEALKKRFGQFVSRLKAHESQENTLILDVCNLEMGGGD